MDRHEQSGMYYNWYDPADGRVLRRWPDSGDLVVPFVSSVDMGWLGAATWAVRNALPGARRRADRLTAAGSASNGSTNRPSGCSR